MCPVRLYTFRSAALACVTSVTLHRNVWSTRFAVARFCFCILSFNSFEPAKPEGPAHGPAPGERSGETTRLGDERQRRAQPAQSTRATRACDMCTDVLRMWSCVWESFSAWLRSQSSCVWDGETQFHVILPLDRSTP